MTEVINMVNNEVVKVEVLELLAHWANRVGSDGYECSIKDIDKLFQDGYKEIICSLKGHTSKNSAKKAVSCYAMGINKDVIDIEFSYYHICKFMDLGLLPVWNLRYYDIYKRYTGEKVFSVKISDLNNIFSRVQMEERLFCK